MIVAGMIGAMIFAAAGYAAVRSDFESIISNKVLALPRFY
jgi:hypothetical protein